jgi:hypothetical protein
MIRWATLRNWRLLAVILLVLFVATPAWAQEGGFTEDFESGELTGWELSPDVVIIEGALRISAGSFAFKGGQWRDYTLQIRVRTSGPGDVILHYYARDESRYQLHLLPEEIIIDRSLGERSEILGAAGTEAVESGDWVDLTLQVVDGEHQVSIEGDVILTATDPEPLQGGSLGLVFAGEAFAEFDDMSLTPMGGPPPEGEGGPPMEGEPHPEGEGEPPPGEEFPPGEEGRPPVGETAEAAAQEPTEPEGWLESFLSGQAQPLELQTFVINLLLSAILAFILGRVYIFWGTSLSNRRAFAANFMLITITTTFIILVVRSSVALSLGLVGALSIVRFRAAIKEPEELAYLFFAIGIGIGLGDNQRLITILAMVVGIALIGILRLFHGRQADMNLHLTVASGNPEMVELDAVMQALKQHSARLRLLRFDETGTAFESTFLVEFQDLGRMHAARKALRALSPEIEITFMDNRGME